MKFKTVKLITSLFSITTPALAISCTTNEKTIDVENLEDIKSKWDTEITIYNKYINPGFRGSPDGLNFVKELNKRFNDLKNKDPLTKNLKNVKFNFQVQNDANTIYNELEADNKKYDIGIMNYTNLYTKFLGIENPDYQFNPTIKLVAQTNTKKFIWQTNANTYYTRNKMNKELLESADQNNIHWFKNTNLEYPDWTKDKPLFENSAYSEFYKKNELTNIYRGAIYIAGNESERNQIKKDWEDKNFFKFVSHGITFENTDSASGYKYQVALMARHFGKTIKELNEYFSNTQNKNVVKNLHIKKTLGKATSGIVPKIGFSPEGELNWILNTKGDNYFKPDGFVSKQKFNDPNNKVIRTFIFTNPAGYDVVLGRRNLSDKQVDLISQTLQSFNIEDNLYGAYTGYNRFSKIDKELFKKFILLQIQAETTKDLIDEI
ncbi:ABC transporter thiamine pyrophosphate-binding lipoprotein p37/Cypl [Mycoplasma phocoenae]|uniref:ABC transporter substrate-binding protein n=1 Tax=Mycoplasma phocoenae TaxID=754517 RepID=A0A858U3P3_9MOLU|nr:ABC transporter substrate-binding protein [Mycoplasma phocoenae]QJG67042.1 ABC transporter substrate-binding protein [Mycoplasma phocoenae]